MQYRYICIYILELVAGRCVYASVAVFLCVHVCVGGGAFVSD